MHPPEMVVAIFTMLMPVLIVIITLGHREKMAKLKAQSASDDASVIARMNEFAQRLEKIEKRMANVETIVLDTEKARQFDRSL